MTTTDVHKTLTRAVRRILRPLVRILLRNGIPYADLAEEVRRVYVEIAMTEFQVPGRKPSVSRTATITGLTRKEVRRLLDTDPDAGETPGMAPHNRAAQVVAGWARDPDFRDRAGNPRALTFDDTESGFPALVRRYSGDMTSRAVFDELQRVGVVERDANDRVHLLARSYIPAQDDREKIEILGTDTHYLMETIRHNLDHTGPEARFQRKVLYDDLPEEYVEQFRREAAEQCQELIERLDRDLARHDRGINPRVDGTGRRLAGVSIFYFEEDLGDRKDEENEQ